MKSTSGQQAVKKYNHEKGEYHEKTVINYSIGNNACVAFGI